METYQPATLKRDLSKGIRCKNTSGEEIPAFSAFMIGSEVSGVVQAIKPNEDSAKQVLFSPANAVPANGSFFAMSPYDEYVTYSGSPAIGDELGTASGAWTLSPDQTGFVMLSGSGGVARCRPFSSGISRYELDKTDSSTSGSTTEGTWHTADTLTLTGDNVIPFFTGKSVSLKNGSVTEENGTGTIFSIDIQANEQVTSGLYNVFTRLVFVDSEDTTLLNLGLAYSAVGAENAELVSKQDTNLTGGFGTVEASGTATELKYQYKLDYTGGATGISRFEYRIRPFSLFQFTAPE